MARATLFSVIAGLIGLGIMAALFATGALVQDAVESLAETPMPKTLPELETLRSTAFSDEEIAEAFRRLGKPSKAEAP